MRTLVKDSSHYLTGQIFLMAAGFISFPIFTRIFSVSDYGILGLLTTTLFIGGSIAKFGFPGSIVQFYAEFRASKRFDSFFNTMVISSIGIGMSVAILFYIGVRLSGDRLLGKAVLDMAPLVSILIFTTCANDILTSFMRAEQRTKLYNLIAIIRRYGAVGLSIFLVLYLIKGLRGFYFGQVIWSMVIVLLLVLVFREKIRARRSHFSLGILTESSKFGFPLVCAELGHLVLHYADRYLIQIYLGSVFLGLYTAGNNLATYVTEVITYPVNYALTPIYMNLLITKGEQETKLFLAKSFRYFFLILFGMVFGFIAVGKDILTFFATDKFEAAFVILPYVVIGQAIYACSLILNNGLFIRRKTYLMTIILIGSSGLNVGLNTILIPRYGMVGAAVASLVSNIAYTIVVTYFAFKEFGFEIDYGHIVRYLFASLAMFVVISFVNGGSPLGNLAAKIAIGFPFYIGTILILDREIRNMIIKMIARFFRPRVSVR